MNSIGNAIPPSVLVFIVAALSTPAAPQQRQPMTIIRLYTGSDRQTHEENVEVKVAHRALSKCGGVGSN